jgi:hypothetical protein
LDTHAIEVGAGALVIAAASGFGGAYVGARTTARNDRIERARTRRIEAADDLVQAWATALFAIDEAINQLPAPGGQPRVPQLLKLVNDAVKLSVRLDLLFTAISLPAQHTNEVRDHARAAIAAIERGDANEARRAHAGASLSLGWLVNTAAEAIESTGTRRDAARSLKEMLKDPEANLSRR